MTETKKGLSLMKETKESKPLASEAQNTDAARGVSNTPVTALNSNKHVEVRIDYLKVRFDFPFDEYEPEVMQWWDDVLDAFLIDRETRVDMRRGGSNYELGWHYHEDFFVFTGGELTKSNGQPTSMFEMKGMACERFCERVRCRLLGQLNEEPGEAVLDEAIRKAWANALSIIAALPHRCTRIDLPVDDFNENVPVVELMQKCRDHHFVSAAKKCFGANGVPFYEMSYDDEAVVRDGLGWSFTVGKTESERQLCIYDKKAEWENGHKGIVIANTLIRFESRFKGDRADHMLDCVTKALNSADPLAFRKLVIGALTTLIEFKVGHEDNRNTSHSETWPAWAKFVEIGVLPPKFKAKVPVKTIKRNALWHRRDVSRSKFRLRAAYVEDYDDVDNYLMVDGMQKADGDDLAIVNASRSARKLPCYASVEEMREAVAKKMTGDGSISEAVMTLFDDKIEVELVPIEEKPADAGGQGGTE